MSGLRLVEDQWLAERLGVPALHLVGTAAAHGAAPDAVVQKINARPLFVDLKASVDDNGTVAFAHAHGFTLIDTNLRFSAPRQALPRANGWDVGFAKPDMEIAVGAIAERSFVFDRFHRDPATASRAGVIKRDWARNFFQGGRGDWMVVAVRDGTPVGFLLLLHSASGDLVIDLIAVEAACAGQGVARCMISYAADHCDVSGAVVVGTQVANTRSIQLYEGLGFRLQAAQYVFHHHGGST